MFENVKQSIQNGLQVTKGSHVLYRDYGITGIDDNNPNIRADVSLMISTYYPTVSLTDAQIVSTVDDIGRGQFKYSLNLREFIQ